MATQGLNITDTGKLDKMASDILLQQRPADEPLTISIKDKDWINTAFILSSEKGKSFLDDIDLQNRYYSTAYLKWTDSSLGGNVCINPFPQFTRYADIRIPGLRVSAKETTIQMQHNDLGMGSYYSEAIDDNMQVVHLRFGVPSYNSLFQFFTGFYNSSASDLARTGRFDSTLIDGILKAGKEIVKIAVLPLAIVPLAIGLIGHAARYFMKWPASKFYYLKPTMPAYWTAVNNMMEQIGVNKGVSTNSPAYQQETIMGTTQKINTQETSVLSTLFPDRQFGKDGRIDVYSIATRSKRMQMRHDYALRQQLSNAGNEGWFGRVKKVMNEQGGGLDQKRETETFSLETYLQRFLDVGIISGINELFNGSVEKDIKAPDTSPNADGTAKDLAKTPFAPNADSAKISDHVLANLADGSDWVSFRVNSTGPAQETFSNSTAKSSLAEKVNQLSASARDLRINFAGGNIDSLGVTDTVISGLSSILSNVASTLQMDGLAARAGSAFVDIPDHWSDSTASLNKTTYSLTLISPYGNIISQTLYLYLPLCCLLAGALPLATGKQSYTSPFLCELYDRGRRTTRLGVIDSLTISRGTTNLSFNNDDHPMAIDVSFTVADLSSVVAMPILPGFSIMPGAGLFDPDNLYTDYLMTLSSMSLRDLNDRGVMLTYQAARAKANFASYTSSAKIAQDIASLPGVSMLSALMRGTEKR
jgi:hypothetical protein